jgi:hypothetical protein
MYVILANVQFSVKERGVYRPTQIGQLSYTHTLKGNDH